MGGKLTDDPHKSKTLPKKNPGHRDDIATRKKKIKSAKTHLRGDSGSSARAITAWSRASLTDVQERSISTRLWRHFRTTNSSPSADWRVAVQPIETTTKF